MRRRMLFLAVGAGLLLTHLVLSGLTFCPARLRPLSDAELIQAALDQTLPGLEARDPERASVLRSQIQNGAATYSVYRLTNGQSANNSVFDKVGRVLVGWNVVTVTLDFGAPPPGEIWDPDILVLSACGCLLD